MLGWRAQEGKGSAPGGPSGDAPSQRSLFCPGEEQAFLENHKHGEPQIMTMVDTKAAAKKECKRVLFVLSEQTIHLKHSHL